MIRIFCTKKLAKALPEMPEACKEESDGLTSWCANLIMIGDIDVVVIMCAQTRLGFILWDLDEDQYADLAELISDGIRKVFYYYGIRKEITDDYLSGTPILYTGVERKYMGKLNRLGIDVSEMNMGRDLFEERTFELLPMEYVRAVNDIPVDLTGKDPFFPLDRMRECLAERYGMKPICRPAFELRAVMDLEISRCIRKLLIPVDYTFEDLHRALQVLFAWQGYHLYEFVVGRDKISPEYGGELEPDELASETRLLGRLQEGSCFYYHYDFGDDWEVEIYVDSLQEGYDQPEPTCIGVEGISPPEDVGGVPGFISFMKAYQDPGHPDHEAVIRWAGWKWRANQDIRGMDFRLHRRR